MDSINLLDEAAKIMSEFKARDLTSAQLEGFNDGFSLDEERKKLLADLVKQERPDSEVNYDKTVYESHKLRESLLKNLNNFKDKFEWFNANYEEKYSKYVNAFSDRHEVNVENISNKLEDINNVFFGLDGSKRILNESQNLKEFLLQLDEFKTLKTGETVADLLK